MKKFGVNKSGQIPLHPAVDPGSSRMYVRLPFIIAVALVMALGFLVVFVGT